MGLGFREILENGVTGSKHNDSRTGFTERTIKRSKTEFLWVCANKSKLFYVIPLSWYTVRSTVDLLMHGAPLNSIKQMIKVPER